VAAASEHVQHCSVVWENVGGEAPHAVPSRVFRSTYAGSVARPAPCHVSSTM
jgi:hypothetical protein